MLGLAVAMLLTPDRLHAQDRWTFCSSADFASRRAFLTDPFRADWPRSDLETWFAHSLASRGIVPTAVQCPSPGDYGRIAVDQMRAEEFLRDLGFTIAHVHPTLGRGI